MKPFFQKAVAGTAQAGKGAFKYLWGSFESGMAVVEEARKPGPSLFGTDTDAINRAEVFEDGERLMESGKRDFASALRFKGYE